MASERERDDMQYGGGPCGDDDAPCLCGSDEHENLACFRDAPAAPSLATLGADVARCDGCGRERGHTIRRINLLALDLLCDACATARRAPKEKR